MGFEIKVNVYKDELIMRGNNDGSVDFCKEASNKGERVLLPYLFFSCIDAAIDRIFRMRCNNRDASTLQQLLDNVKEERQLLRNEFKGLK